MELLNALPVWIKAGWLVIAAWAVVQTVWYRRVHVDPPPPPPRRSDSSSRRAAVKPKTAALPIGGSPEFLAELGLHAPTAESSGVDSASVYR